MLIPNIKYLNDILNLYIAIYMKFMNSCNCFMY